MRSGLHDVGQRLAVDRAGRGHRDHRVAVRAERQRLHAADRHAELFGDEVGEPGGVEHAGLAEHPVLREAGGDLRQGGHLVERVGHHDHHRVRRVPGDVLGDLPDDAGVGLDEVHPAHARLARQAGGDDDDGGARDRLVAGAVLAGRDPGDLGLEALDRTGLVQVESQAFRLALDDVGEDDLVEDVVLGEALRRGGAVEPGSDDGDLAQTVACHDLQAPSCSRWRRRTRWCRRRTVRCGRARGRR